MALDGIKSPSQRFFFLALRFKVQYPYFSLYCNGQVNMEDIDRNNSFGRAEAADKSTTPSEGVAIVVE